MVKCKARVAFKQYLPKKPTKWGFKVFAASDAESSMLCNFSIYTGQGQGDGDSEGLTHRVVVRSTQDLQLENHGYVLFTDNFYTSPALAASLRGRGIYLVGTVKTNRRGFPAELSQDTQLFEKCAERGSTRYVRRNDTLFQQWKDQR